MKLHDASSILPLLHEHAVLDMKWPETDEGIDAVIAAAQASSTESKLCTDSEREARVHAVLDELGSESGARDRCQMVLFDGVDTEQQVGTPDRAAILQIVRKAYIRVHDRYSSDRIVADPDMDALFIRECWRLGAQASQFKLNQFLLNARKRSILGKTDGVRRYRVDPALMDQYVFGSEFAARLIQEREHKNNDRKITIDYILCEPKFAKELDEIASSIAPGFTPLDYRWALLVLRKAKSRRDPLAVNQLPFDWLGRLDSIRVSRLNAVSGFVWVRSAETQVYVGHSENLRTLVDRVMQCPIERVLDDLPLFRSDKSEPLELGIAECPKSSVASRDSYKNALVLRCDPCLNVRQWQTSRTPGKDNANGKTKRTRGAA